jgi:hypothetical protein
LKGEKTNQQKEWTHKMRGRDAIRRCLLYSRKQKETKREKGKKIVGCYAD